MSVNTPHVYRHGLTGQLTTLTEEQASAFPDTLEMVEDDAKPYLPEMFKPDAPKHKGRKTAAERRAEKQAEVDVDAANAAVEANTEVVETETAPATTEGQTD